MDDVAAEARPVRVVRGAAARSRGWPAVGSARRLLSLADGVRQKCGRRPSPGRVNVEKAVWSCGGSGSMLVSLACKLASKMQFVGQIGVHACQDEVS